MHPVFELIYKGMLLGVITAFSFGPIFFTIIETSISKGHRWAISIAVGVFLSDALIITASFFSLGRLIQDDNAKDIIGTVGGLLLVAFGIYYLLKPVPPPRTLELNKGSHISYFLYLGKGLVINTINPFVFVYWFSAVSIVTVDQEYDEAEKFLFFGAAILCNFGFDVLKTFLAVKMKNLMTARTMNIISKCIGVGVIYFGMRLLWKTMIT